jgi:acetylornithine deacetylase/succinyl-diaminopimelate desuccinylase-like protein
MVAPDLPAITYALRGGMRADVTVYGPKHDLHSGTFGGAVLNPAQALSTLIAGLHDEHGRVTLPGFYDRVRPLQADERADLARLPLDEAFFLQETGAPELWGEAEYTPFERTTARPTLEVLSFHAGLSGDGQLNIVPARASAAISTRLVPDQDPHEIYTLLLRYFEAHTPRGVRWEARYVVGGRPALTERDTHAVQTLRRALRETWDVEPVFVRMGGGIPVVSMFKEELGIDSLLSGFGLMDDNIHGPNEKLHLPTWYAGMEAIVRFVVSYA